MVNKDCNIIETKSKQTHFCVRVIKKLTFKLYVFSSHSDLGGLIKCCCFIFHYILTICVAQSMSTPAGPIFTRFAGMVELDCRWKIWSCFSDTSSDVAMANNFCLFDPRTVTMCNKLYEFSHDALDRRRSCDTQGQSTVGEFCWPHQYTDK